MQKLFIDYTPENEIILDGEQARHIARSLRMKKGDMLIVNDSKGNDFGCIIEEITKETVRLSVCYQQASDCEPDCKVRIYQANPKGSKIEDIIQKCVELGVFDITPVLTARCVSRPDEKSAKKKTERYNKIALEAAQQSGRGIVPKVNGLIPLKQAVREDDSEVKIVFYEGGGAPLRELVGENTKSVSIYIGPEGGFEKEEVDLIVSNGASAATLGKRILRTQTAPVAALSAIMLITNNLE